MAHTGSVYSSPSVGAAKAPGRRRRHWTTWLKLWNPARQGDKAAQGFQPTPRSRPLFDQTQDCLRNRMGSAWGFFFASSRDQRRRARKPRRRRRAVAPGLSPDGKTSRSAAYGDICTPGRRRRQTGGWRRKLLNFGAYCSFHPRWQKLSLRGHANFSCYVTSNPPVSERAAKRSASCVGLTYSTPYARPAQTVAWIDRIS